MNISDWIQFGVGVVLLATFFAVLFYAYETKKMRLEMKKQRLDSLRPIIDVVVGSLKSSGLIPEWSRLKGSKFGDKLPWEVSNIGVGPALELEVSLVYPTQPQPFNIYQGGTLARESKASFTLEEDNVPYGSPPPSGSSVVATYVDVYGRQWQSKRDLSFDTANGVIKYGHLIVPPLEGNHDP